ncbi:MAG: signal peptidase I [Solirubrobacterales bacterium]
MRMPRPQSTFGAIVELLAIVAFAVGLALLIQAFLVKPYVIPSGSMIPTLEEGQRVLVQRVGYHLSDPEVGDIVVFHPPEGAQLERCGSPAQQPPQGQVCVNTADTADSDNFIKRVVATPGDTLKVVDGHAIVNGEPIEDDFIKPCGGGPSCNFPKEVTIPADTYFMMGDNRGSSDDSRFWGPVPRDWIIGKTFATYWPPNRVGIF